MSVMTLRLGKTARLIRTLQRHADASGIALAAVDVAEHPWASATFDGTRVTLWCTLSGRATGAWLAALPDAELAVRGAFVADLAVAQAQGEAVLLSVLLIDAS